MSLDIGPKTIELYSEQIANAKTIVWNGPMGCFEMTPFASGTNAICKAVANADCTSIIGGGDSVAAVKKSGVAEKMSHVYLVVEHLWSLWKVRNYRVLLH